MPYPGGKGGAGVYQTIINGMPRHEVYVEPFLGGGAVMAAKRPAGLNIGVDLDAEVVAQARSRIVENGEVRSTLAGCRDAADSPGEAMRDGTAGIGITAGAIVSDGDNGRYEFHVGDGIAFLQKYPFHGGELVYCDPPYLHSTRRDPGLYRYEMADHQHEALLAILLRLPCLACISGYWSALYAETLSTWRLCSFQAQTRCGVVTEYLWCNYPAPTALHDYRYLGKDFRERERIKRMTARWVNRLQAMPLLQRQALQAALAQVDNGGGRYRQGYDEGLIAGAGEWGSHIAGCSGAHPRCFWRWWILHRRSWRACSMCRCSDGRSSHARCSESAAPAGMAMRSS